MRRHWSKRHKPRVSSWSWARWQSNTVTEACRHWVSTAPPAPLSQRSFSRLERDPEPELSSTSVVSEEVACCRDQQPFTFWTPAYCLAVDPSLSVPASWRIT